MARRKETRTIGGVEVTCEQLPVLRSELLWVRLLKLFAPAARALPSLSMKTDMRELAALLGVSLEYLDLDEYRSCSRELLRSCTARKAGEGRGIPTMLGDDDAVIDALFDGDLRSYYELLAFAAEVNYRRFFTDARAVLTAKLAGASQPEPMAANG